MITPVRARGGARLWRNRPVKAIQNLKIDKITVWDAGAAGRENGAGGSTSHFLRGLISSLPPIHELAQQAGIDLPEVLGRVQKEAAEKSGGGDGPERPAGAASAGHARGAKQNRPEVT